MYKLVKTPYIDEIRMVLWNDSTYIPFDPANTDYQEYLKWLAAGNTPEPADEQN